MIRKQSAQSMVEFTVLMIVVVSALVIMSTYVKRGVQGRWKQSVDDFGDQYDPAKVNAITTYTMTTNSQSNVLAVPMVDAFTGATVYSTERADSSDTVETKHGDVYVVK